MTKDLSGMSFSAEVTRLEHYGAYFRFQFGEILVLITDIADEPVRHPQERLQLGQRVDVRVLRYLPQYQLYKGRIRGGHPDDVD